MYHLTNKIMKVEPRNIRKFQEGGAMPTGEGGVEGGAPQGGQDPMAQIIPAMEQALQANDCNTLMQICGSFLQMISEAQGMQEQPQPTFARRGGKLVRI